MELITLRRWIRRTSFILSVQVAGACTISFWLGTIVAHAFGLNLSLIGGLWSAISAVCVIHAKAPNAVNDALLRFICTLVASIICAALMAGLGNELAILLLALFATTLCISMVNFKEGYRQAGITLLVIYATSRLQPDLSVWMNALGRLAESTVGILIGLIAVLVFYPLRQWLTHIE